METVKEELKRPTRSLDEILESTPHTKVELPSNGNIYPEDNVLSKGHLHIRYLKGEDEEVLLSPKNIKDVGFIDLLLKRVVLEPEFDVLDLSIGDKTYLVLASRISSLGDEYIVKEVECDFCGHIEENVEFKISESIKDAPEIHYPIESNRNTFEVELPASGDTVIMKTPTGHDIKEFERMTDNLQRTGDSLSTNHTYSVLIQSSTGLEEGATQGAKLKYVRNLPLKDTNHLRRFLNEIRRTPDNTIDYECTKCGTKQEVPISFGFNFFFPNY